LAKLSDEENWGALWGPQIVLKGKTVVLSYGYWSVGKLNSFIWCI